MLVQQQAFDVNLELLAARWSFNALELRAYAAEDDIGGFDADETRRIWPMGSLWQEEGKMLYSLVRALKPQYVCEIGTLRGCSATHITAALRANNSGTLYSIDTNEASGDLIPDLLRSYIQLIHQDGVTWLLQQPDNHFGLIYMDGNHGVAEATAGATLAQTKLTPGGVYAAHDAAHFGVGEAICTGLTAALGNDGFTVYLSWPSDCGLGIYRRKEEVAPVETWPKIMASEGAFDGLKGSPDDARIRDDILTFPEALEFKSEVESSIDPLSTARGANEPGQINSETATSSGRKGKRSGKGRKPRSDRGVKRARSAKGTVTE